MLRIPTPSERSCARRTLRQQRRRASLAPLKRKLKRTVGIGVAVATVLLALIMTALANRPSPKVVNPAVQLADLSPVLEVSIESDGTPLAPTSVVVTTPTEPNGTPVRLDVQSAFMTARLVGAFVDKRAEFVVPPNLLIDSGVLVITATTKESIGIATLKIRPASAANGVIPLAGPRSIVADRKHWTMVSVIPGDALGNGLPDGTPVRLHVRRPDGQTDIVEGTIDGLLDGIRVYGGTVSGLTTIRVEVQGATGPEIEVREVAGPPMPFSLEGPSGPLVADGRSLIEIRTPLLVDQFGNTVEDGTSAEVRGEAPDGPFRLVSTTIDGRAIFRLRSSAEPGPVSVVAEVAGTFSAPTEFELTTDALRFDLSVTRRGTDVDLLVGPVISSLGGFAPDGTDVVVEVNGVSVRALQVRDGQAKSALQVDRGDIITVKILGRSADATAP